MLNRKDKERIEQIKRGCTKCNGYGVTFSNGAFEDCTCIATINKELKLLEAKIPLQYVNFTPDKLTAEFKSANAGPLAEFMSFVGDLRANSGQILWLASAPGLAKSSLISWGLLRAFDQQLTPYFSRATQLLQLKLDALKQEDKRKELDYILEDVDVLAIEELDKVYSTAENFVTSQFFDLISDLYDLRKTLIISSNGDHASVGSTFPLYIRDRLSTARLVMFTGVSGR